MKVDITLRWLIALTLAVSALPTGTEAQNRGRERMRRTRVAMPNMFVQSASRARLGLYLDARQSRRHDDEGALITDVMHRSPAEDAGLRDGDIITAFDGQVLTEPLAVAEMEDDLDRDGSLPAQRALALAREMEPGQTVEIRYLRDGESLTVEIEAEEFDFPRVMSFGPEGGDWTFEMDENDFRMRTDEFSDRMRDLGDRLGSIRGFTGSSGRFGGDCPGSGSSWGSDTRGCAAGVEFRELNPRLGEYFGADRGVLVIDVDDDSALGLMPGDVILAIGDREVEDIDRVRRLINSYEEDEPIRMTIIRKGAEEVIEGSLIPY